MPLLAITSAVVTLAFWVEAFKKILPLDVEIAIALPSTEFAVLKVAAVAALTEPLTTWYFKISASNVLFSGFTSKLTVDPAGLLKAKSKAVKASLVGAKTVNGPVLDKVGTKPAAVTAATKVEVLALALAISTIVVVAADALIGEIARIPKLKTEKICSIVEVNLFILIKIII